MGLIFNTGNEVERTADRYTEDTPIDLARFDQAFQRARATEGEDGQEAIPDGYYDTLVEEVRLTKTRTGNPMVVWKLTILSEDFHGLTLN